MRRRGSILVALLWCLALLGVLVISILHTSRIDLIAAKNGGDAIQARYLALAGVEKAKAVIFHDAANRQRAAVNHTTTLFDAPEQFRDVAFGRGQFRVIHQAPADEGGATLYGVSDEAARLNVNEASIEELGRLEGMRPEVAAAIVDWRDRDSNPSPGGAESEYYASLRPPYLPRNGRIQTARELLLVRGVDPDLLLGEDANLNGVLDPEEDDGDFSEPPDNQNGRLETGWAGFLGFESQVQNKNAAGQARVNVQEADESTLATVPGITRDLAKAIVAYRGENKLESIADLLEVSALAPASGPNPGPPGNPRPDGTPNGPRRAAVGPKLIDEDLFLRIGDDVTTTSDVAQRGLVNINSAEPLVLKCLPGMTEELARAIVLRRESAGPYPNIAWLLKVQGMSREIFKQLAPRITARSETFRILSEGRVTSTGARARLEVIVQLRNQSIATISYRELL